MSSFCGLDFGTSNSTIGIQQAGKCQLVLLENNKPTLRSAIFCDAENKQWVFGQEGVARYLTGTPGRLLMALKSVLGSSLMSDETLIFSGFISYTSILSHFMRYIKTQAEEAAQHELTQVVLGRPVHFHDTDLAQDQKAQATLEQLAKDIGFKEISFQYEPIAAALAYETSIQSEQLALIVDMGGGTSDFTVIRLNPHSQSLERGEDVLANAGIHIAGTDFDHALSMQSVMPLLGLGSKMQGSSSVLTVPAMYYHELTTWHTLANLYNPKTISHVRSIQAIALEKERIGRLINVLQKRAGHMVLNTVEMTKQRLSDSQINRMDLEFVEPDLHVDVSRETFNQSIHAYVEKITESISQTIQIAGVKLENINAIFYTGGSTKIPFVKETINPLFPNATIVEGDAFGSVGLGLTIEADRRYR